jgi:galactokinase/N-acetylgalactosamine kinase
VVVENLNTAYPRQVFAPSTVRAADKSEKEGWHLDINTKELRWESYIKAGYYVRI